MRSLSRLTAAVVGLAVLVSPARAQEKAKFDNLMQALRASGALNGKAGPQDVNWINGGRRFSFTIRGDSGEQIRAFDPASGADTLLFSAQGHTFPGSQEPFTYRSFQWSQDSRYLVFQSHFKPLYRRSGTGDFYVYSVADGSMEKAASEARTAELSPDGKTLGYERGGDMFVFDLAGKKETRLTSDATDSVFNGHFDWVYEEEFGMAQAWNWSPDSRYIAYWQLDERPEPVSQFTDYAGQHPDWDRIPVPLVGDSNAKVRIGVVNVKTGSKQWLDTGENQDTYIPRIYWTSQQDTLAVVTLNRLQNTMKLFFFDVNTGGRRLVMGDSSKTWIDIYDFYAGIQDMLTFPANSHEFFWISDRDGWQHVYRYDYSGKLIKQVTSGKWSVTRVEGIDSKAKKIYYTSTEASPLQRQLYVVGFDGRGEKRLTTEQGTHSIDMSPNTQYYIDRWSSTTQPRQVELWATGHKMLKKLEDNAQVTEWIKTHAYSPAELFSFTTSDGVKLDGSLVKPTDFDSTRRYPMIFAVYGGPGRSRCTTGSKPTAGRSGWRSMGTWWWDSTTAGPTTTAAPSRRSSTSISGSGRPTTSPRRRAGWADSRTATVPRWRLPGRATAATPRCIRWKRSRTSSRSGPPTRRSPTGGCTTISTPSATWGSRPPTRRATTPARRYSRRRPSRGISC